MKKKVTLSLDRKAVEKGKRLSRRNKKSFSSFIQSLIYEQKDENKKSISDSLVGILKLEKGETIDSIREDYINEKHLK